MDDHYAELLTPEWRKLTYTAQRSQLQEILTGYSRIANQPVGTRALADLAIGNIEFTKDGSDAVGYRISFTDSSANGAKKRIAWVVRRPEGYRILGLRGDQSTVGGEALALAEKGNLEGARTWLDWEREEMNPAPGTDPLASEAFLKLWPSQKGVPESDAIIAARCESGGARSALPGRYRRTQTGQGAHSGGIFSGRCR